MELARRSLLHFRAYLWLALAAVAFSGASFLFSTIAERRLAGANRVRLESFQLADELRQTSDDLTRMVRTYVATGDPLYKQRYREILDIRNGVAPRPVEDHGLYWDFVLHDDRRPTPMGAAISLLDRLKAAGFATDELAKLAEAKARSDDLVRRETAAMDLVDAAGGGLEERRRAAIELLHDADYHRAKAGIMAPISEFDRMVDLRTGRLVGDAERRAGLFRAVSMAFGAVLVLILWRLRRSLHDVLGAPLHRLLASIASIAAGDLSEPLPEGGGRRGTVMAHLATMQRSLAALQAERTREERARLRESEERFRSLVESSLMGVYIFQDGVLTYANPALSRILGYPPGALVGLDPVQAVVDPRDQPMVMEHLRRKAAGEGAAAAYRFRGLRKDGAQLTLEARSTSVELDGRPAIIGNILDVTARVRAEEALQASEARFRTLIDGAPVAISISRVGTMLYANRKLLETYRFEQLDDVVGHPVGVLWADEVRAEIEERARRRARGEPVPSAYESVGRRTDGTTFPVEVYVETVSLSDGPASIAFLVDVTEQRASRRRMEGLNRLYAVLREIYEAIARGRRRADLLDAACRVVVEVGLFRMAWIGLWSEAGRLEPAASAGVVDGYLDEVRIEDGGPRGQGPSGRAAHSGGHAVCDDLATDPGFAPWREAALRRGYRASAAFPLKVKGKVVGAFNVYAAEPGAFTPDQVALLDRLALDLGFALEREEGEAEQRLVEQALAESEQRFRQIAESIDEAFWMIDPETQRTLYVSPGYEKIWGRPRQGAPTSPLEWAPAVHPDDQPRVREATRLKLGRGDYDETYRILRPDGSERWIHDRAFPLRDAAGRLSRIVGTTSDITERQTMEAQLRQAQKMEAIGVLAGGVAHDFNNVLAVILSYAALILEDLRPGDPLREEMEEIRVVARRAAELTRQLLAFSRQQVLQPRLVDLVEVVEGMTRMLSRLIGADVRLVTLLPAGERVPLFVDPGQIEQVLMNLAVNARDAMPRGGTLTISVERLGLEPAEAARLGLSPGPHVLVSVVDTGEGMDRATQARIFEPFFTTKPAGKGTGLGLSTVFGIVRQSGGHVAVESERGRGTTFRVWLPLAPEGTAGATPGTPVPALEARELRGTETVLLVDDDEHVRRLARTILSRHGYRVLEAGGGGDALVLSEQHEGSIGLVLTDLVMPLMSGEQLVERLSRQHPGLRVLFMSGSVFRAGAELPAGANFLPKPFTPERLLGAVRLALGPPPAR